MIFAPILHLCYNDKMIMTEPKVLQKQTKQTAFTLVEMLVVLGIVGLMFGVGIANFFRYRQRQEIEQTAYDVQNFIQKIKTYAKNGNRGGENNICNQEILTTKLISWEITYDDNNNQLIARPKCLYQGITEKEGDPDIFNLPLHYKIANNATNQFNKIAFQAVFGGIIFADGANTSDSIKVVVQDEEEEMSYQFHITSGGVISSGCWCETSCNNNSGC